MKKSEIKVSYFFAGLIWLCTVGEVQAAVSCNSNSCTGPINEMITSIFPTSSGDLLFTAPQLVQTLGCDGANGGDNFRVNKSHEGLDSMLRIGLTALALNKSITLRRDTGETDCVVLFLRLHV